MRAPLRIAYTGNRNCVYVSGHGSWDVLYQLRRRKPLWAREARAWVTTERVAADVLAAAQARGWVVETVGVPHESPQLAAVASSPAKDPDEAQEALW